MLDPGGNIIPILFVEHLSGRAEHQPLQLRTSKPMICPTLSSQLLGALALPSPGVAECTRQPPEFPNKRAYLGPTGDEGLGSTKSLRAVGDFSGLSNSLKTMMAFSCPVLGPAVGDENLDGCSSCSELQPRLQKSQRIFPLGWGSLPRLGRISVVTGSPVSAGDAAPAA